MHRQFLRAEKYAEFCHGSVDLILIKLKENIYTLVTQRANTIQMEKLEWVWPDRIPAGKICPYTGKPSCGKSLAILDLVARVTTGKDCPDAKNPSGLRDVVLAATEDDLGTTLVPRLVACDADLSRIHIVKRVTVEGKKNSHRMLQLKEGAQLIRRMLRDHPDVALIALDPISGFFGDVDPNKDKEIRPVLESVQAALEQSKTALVGIIHQARRYRRAGQSVGRFRCCRCLPRRMGIQPRQRGQEPLLHDAGQGQLVQEAQRHEVQD
jgi:hypothetical protein